MGQLAMRTLGFTGRHKIGVLTFMLPGAGRLRVAGRFAAGHFVIAFAARPPSSSLRVGSRQRVFRQDRKSPRWRCY
jgi:hypothetical protein